MLRELCFWGVIPFLIPQAMHVSRTAPRFAGATGSPFGVVGEGEGLTLLAIGDSIVAGVGATDFPRSLVGRTAESLSSKLGRRVDWTAHGRIGAKSADVLDELIEQVDTGSADVVLVSVGVNDITGLRTTGSWVRNLRSILARLREHSPEAVIALNGLPPLSDFPLLPQPLRAVIGLRGRTFDHAARDVIDECSGVIHVPIEFETSPEKFADDGFHPSETAYLDFADAVADAVIAELAI